MPLALKGLWAAPLAWINVEFSDGCAHRHVGRVAEGGLAAAVHLELKGL